ncbi:MAG: hypothetical protein AAGH42_07350 [Pseudomonadota bacterium]
MRFVFILLTGLAALLALFTVGLTVGGVLGDASGPDGMALLAFQLYGALTSLVSLILGVLGLVFLNEKPRRIPVFAIVAGGAGLLALGGMMMIG